MANGLARIVGSLARAKRFSNVGLVSLNFARACFHYKQVSQSKQFLQIDQFIVESFVGDVVESKKGTKRMLL